MPSASLFLVQIKDTNYFNQPNIPETDVGLIQPFHNIFRRYEPFIRDVISLTVDSEDQPQAGISSTGENVFKLDNQANYFVSGVTLKITLPTVTAVLSSAGSQLHYLNWTNNVGHALIEEVSLYSNGKKQEKLDSYLLDIYQELYENESTYISTGKSACKNTYLRSGKLVGQTGSSALNHTARTLYIKIPFWFTKNLANALPLFKLKDIDIRVKYKGLDSLINTNGPVSSVSYSGFNHKMLVEIINIPPNSGILCNKDSGITSQLIEYMDIERCANLNITSSNPEANFNFDFPSSKLLWIVKDDATTAATAVTGNVDATVNIQGLANGSRHGNDYFNYSSNSTTTEYYVNGIVKYQPFSIFQLKISNKDYPDTSSSEGTGLYYNFIEPNNNGLQRSNKNIYVYSFSTDIKKTPIFEPYYINNIQPTGVLNFTSNDTYKYKFTSLNSNSKANIYSISYAEVEYSGNGIVIRVPRA